MTRTRRDAARATILQVHLIQDAATPDTFCSMSVVLTTLNSTWTLIKLLKIFYFILLCQTHCMVVKQFYNNCNYYCRHSR